jgi:hypothetical protein
VQTTEPSSDRASLSPPYLIPLVAVLGGKFTSPRATNDAFDFDGRREVEIDGLRGAHLSDPGALQMDLQALLFSKSFASTVVGRLAILFAPGHGTQCVPAH